jgi:phosphatidate phosphatase
LLAAWLFVVVLYYAEPFKRGFFCNDESLMHPYHSSTVGNSLGIVGIGLPITLIVVTEILRWKLTVDDNRATKLFNRDFPNWVLNVYKYVGQFVFGAVLTIVITDVGKHVLGRLRPHFMSVCLPIMPDGTNCSDPINMNRYIEDFTCSNADSSEERLKEATKSFPSGHSSLAMYTMLFAVFYLQRRMTWDGPKTLKPIIQFSLVTMAWYTALSRISDYKHHCELIVTRATRRLIFAFLGSDVLAGSLLGISVCLAIVFAVSDLFRNKPQSCDLPQTTKLSSSQESVQT